jgi:Mn2+/Fe2+ NRAMP family transporter
MEIIERVISTGISGGSFFVCREVIGSAIAINILTGAPLWVGVVVTAVDVFLVLLLESFGTDKI